MCVVILVQRTDALGDLLGLGGRVSDITLGDTDAVGLEELGGAVLVDGEVASLLQNRRILDWRLCQSQRGPVSVEGLSGPTLTAWNAEAACLLRASLNMANM